MPPSSLLIFKLLIAWSVFCFVRGVFNAEDYWGWKNLLLTYSFSILVPFSIIIGLNYENATKMFRFVIVGPFLFGFFFIPYAFATDYELYARIVIPVSLFVLFVPYLAFKWRILIAIVATISVMVDISYRINAVRIIVSTLILFYFYYGMPVTKKLLNLLVLLMFCLPLVFLTLGVSSKFNIFQENVIDHEIMMGNDNSQKETNLSSDTRTFLYKEVFYSMLKRDSSFIIGEGGGSGYESVFFEDTVLSSRGRYAAEVGFLNAVLYSGAIGVLLYALMLFMPAYYAINHSNNSLCKMLGVFLSFHWIVFFIEDNILLNMNFYFIWIVVGLCLSNKFRGLSDLDLRDYFRFQ